MTSPRLHAAAEAGGRMKGDHPVSMVLCRTKSPYRAEADPGATVGLIDPVRGRSSG
jgi:hypothetical protein